MAKNRERLVFQVLFVNPQISEIFAMTQKIEVEMELIAEEDWRAIQETLSLLSIPQMKESIREGMETPVEDCAKELDW